MSHVCFEFPDDLRLTPAPILTWNPNRIRDLLRYFCVCKYIFVFLKCYFILFQFLEADFSLTDKITLALKAQLVKLPKPKVIRQYTHCQFNSKNRDNFCKLCKAILSLLYNSLPPNLQFYLFCCVLQWLCCIFIFLTLSKCKFGKTVKGPLEDQTTALNLFHFPPNPRLSHKLPPR